MRGIYPGGISTHFGTAGAMLDFSLAGGLAPTVSSFSRIVFSPAARRRAAMAMNVCGGSGWLDDDVDVKNRRDEMGWDRKRGATVLILVL